MEATNGLDVDETDGPEDQVDFDRRLLELAGRQHYVVTRDQLLAFGTARQVEHRIATRRLVHVHETVYRVAGSPRTWHQQLLAACSRAPAPTRSRSGRPRQLWELPGGDEIVEVTAPRHRPHAVRTTSRMHESFFLTDLDVTYLHGIPVTRPARGDLRPGAPRRARRAPPDDLELALQEAFRRDLVDLPRVRRELERLGGVVRPGGRVVEESPRQLRPAGRKTDSTPEVASSWCSARWGFRSRCRSTVSTFR